MTQTINQVNLLFEYLEDDLKFEYNLKSETVRGNKYQTISYYRNNMTVKIAILDNLAGFTLNFIIEKENSYRTTSLLNSLLLQGNCELNDFVKAKQKLNTKLLSLGLNT